jgi:hypothetical protein
MTLLILLALAFSRPYHMETVASLGHSMHTHVQVAGYVSMVRREADGDWHIRVSDEKGRFIVAEIIPAMPMAPPKVGQGVVVFGIRREDNERGHGWAEVHPVEKWIEAVK